MIVLTTSNTLTVELAEATVTTEPDFVSSYVDQASPDAPGMQKDDFSGVSAVIAIAAPSSGTRLAHTIYVTNNDTVEHTAILKHTGGTSRVVCRVTLSVGQATELIHHAFETPDLSAYIRADGTVDFSADQSMGNNALTDIKHTAFKAATEKTVATGTLTVDQGVHKVQPESGTTDDIATISGMPSGSTLVLVASDAGTDTLTLKHGTGNLSCFGGSDIELSEGMVVCYYDGTTVYVAGGGGSAGGGGGYNEAFRPFIDYPNIYENMSGLTGRWSSTGSGTNEWQYDWPGTPEPTDVLYGSASATRGTAGSLADHQWDFSGGKIIVRDDSGDPDGLAENLWRYDIWGITNATPAFASEGANGFWVHFDNATDQGIVCKLKAIPADVTTWTLKMFVRSSDRNSSGMITVRALDRAIQTGGAAKPTATTLATATLSLTATGSIVEISGTIANLDATTGEIPEICIIRDVSADVVLTPMAADLDTVEVQYAVA